MNKVVFVTHNKGKIETAKELLKEVEFEVYEYELDGKIEISKEQIDGDDVVSVLQEATVEKIGENDELVSIIPIMFSLDEDKFTDNPNGMISKSLGVKAL